MYLDKVKKITQIMHVIEKENVELASYLLKDVAYDWVELWRKSKWEDATPMTWQLFQDAFLDQFFPLRAERSKTRRIYELETRLYDG